MIYVKYFCAGVGVALIGRPYGLLQVRQIYTYIADLPYLTYIAYLTDIAYIVHIVHIAYIYITHIPYILYIACMAYITYVDNTNNIYLYIRTTVRSPCLSHV